MKNEMYRVSLEFDTSENSKTNSSPETFTAIDFETAQGPRWSICQVGIIRVENNIIIERYSTLIQPPENIYAQGNINVHGITPEMTKHAKPFPEIWNRIKPYIENQLVVAHNASFDVDALEQTLAFYDMEAPTFDSDCTYSRLGKGLNELCQENNIPLNHHDGLSDAEACAHLFIKFHNSEILQPSKQSKPKKNKPAVEWHKALTGDVLTPDFENADESSPFYMKKVVITGVFENFERDDLGQTLKEKGADIDRSITKKTDFVLVGDKAGPAKLKKIADLQSNGSDIKIIEEEELLEILVESEMKTESFPKL